MRVELTTGMDDVPSGVSINTVSIERHVRKFSTVAA